MYSSKERDFLGEVTANIWFLSPLFLFFWVMDEMTVKQYNGYYECAQINWVP